MPTTLKLSDEEAQTLYNLLGHHIVGDGPREVLTEIWNKLGDAGGGEFREATQPLHAGFYLDGMRRPTLYLSNTPDGLNRPHVRTGAS